MPILVIISQTLLYVCFALALGSFILSLVPKTHRPIIYVPKGMLLTAIGGIPIFSFFPVLQIILYLTPNLGLAQTLQSVLLTFEVGKSWIFTCLFAIILFIFIIFFDYREEAFYASIGIALTFVLVRTISLSSHANAYEGGFLSHTIHLTAVSLWIGILLIVSWFSKDYSNWLNFLKWFTPIAIVCFIGTVVSGLLLMNFALEIEEYPNSWVIPYGQALLIKHLFILPLLIYAAINSVFIKRKLKNDSNFNPIPWAKMESIIILLIFSVTAALGQQSPPHETALTSENFSKLFTLMYQGQIRHEMTVQLVPTVTSISLLILAVLFFALIMISFIKKAPPMMSLLMSILLVFCLYLSLILSIQ